MIWFRQFLEGVAFALADGADALHTTGLKPEEITLIGGGAKSAYWRQMLADILGITLSYREGSDVGPALGAARLARLAISGYRTLDMVCTMPTLLQQHMPTQEKQFYYAEKQLRFRQLYQCLKGL